MQRKIEQLLREWDLSHWSWNLMIIGAAIALGLLIKLLLILFVRRKTERGVRFSLLRSLLHYLGRPLTYFLPLFFFDQLLPIMRLHADIANQLERVLEIAQIVTFAWILLRIIRVVQDWVYYRFDLRKSDNLRERKIRTQLVYIRQIITGLIILLTVAAVLMSFTAFRRIGAGLLTGVGIGGIIIGFAAQRSLGNLLAGLQIAFTQPIRIDDAVIVEDEFGRIEEITLTYVVVRIWDDRRLILPINYFIEKPFQNWTRNTAELLGTVIIYTDYTVPVDAVRGELTRLLQNSHLWDGKANGLDVTDVTPDSVQLRAVVSGRNSGDVWGLRCYVRENLVKFITSNYPNALPRTRAELEGTSAPQPPSEGLIIDNPA